jgi:hypothetical protein
MKYRLSSNETSALTSRVQTLLNGVTDVLTLLQEREGDEVLAAHTNVARDALENLVFELRKRKPAAEASGAASTMTA